MDLGLAARGLAQLPNNTKLFPIWKAKNECDTYNLGHVENDNGRDKANTKASNQTTNHQSSERIAMTNDSLGDTADHVDEATENDSPLAANEVRKVTSNDGAEEGTERQDRDDERGVGAADLLSVGALDDVDEGLETHGVVDVARVIAEEDATERSESADQVGLPGDGSLDALDVAGAVNVLALESGMDGLNSGGRRSDRRDTRRLLLDRSRHGETRCLTVERELGSEN